MPGAAGSSTSLTVTFADAGSGIDPASLSSSNLAASNGATVATVTAVSINGNAVTYTIAAPSEPGAEHAGHLHGGSGWPR